MADVDAELVEALRRGDADGAEQLVERYGGRTYRLALQITARRKTPRRPSRRACGPPSA